MKTNRLKELYKNLKLFARIVNTKTLRKYNYIEILLLWSKRKLSRFQFLVIAGIIVGFLGGLAGILLKLTVHWIQFYLRNDLPTVQRIILYGLLPILGILLSTLIGRYIYKKKKDTRLGDILNDIAKHNSNIDKKHIHMQMLQSAITIGLGGSAGLETPSAIAGAGIGSNFARRYRLGYKEKTLLLAGGASAGIAAAFNAPITGIMFSFEMLLTGVVFSDFIPLVISAMCGSILTRILLSDTILFNITSRSSFDYANLGYYLILAIVVGFYSRYYIVISHKLKTFLNKFRFGSIKRALIGGGILALLCVTFPALYAEGYLNLQMLAEGKTQYIVYTEIIHFFSHPQIILLIALVLSTLFKPIATSATMNSGGVGGNFAPSLIAGGLLGYSFGYFLSLIGFIHVPVLNLMLVGMAGVLSGVLYAPLTGIFLIAESSYGYDLFIPLMIVAVTSFLINKYFSPYNPEYNQLIKEGKIFTTRHDTNLLNQIVLENCMDIDSITVSHKAKFSDVNLLFQDTSKSVLAVIDEKGKFWGMVNKSDMVILRTKTPDFKNLNVSEFAIHPNTTAYTDETIDSIVQKFEESDIWYIPLIDRDDNYKGFISRFRFLKEYRKLLKGLSEGS